MKKNHSKAEEEFAKNIVKEISSGAIASPRELNLRRFFWSKQLGLSEMPSSPFILSYAKAPSKEMLSLLSIKPTRSLSGVSVVSVMLPPFPCPGECVYCPSSFEEKEAPKSYTGFEPSALRAQRLNYDPFKIVSNRIAQLDLTGNFAQKVEIIFQGSSFTCLPKAKRDNVVKQSIEGVLGKRAPSLAAAKLAAERSKRRIVGITFETRPDLCKKKDIKGMLSLGGTRVELGVQNPDNKIYAKVCRGHNVKDVTSATQLLKDSAFKVLYHLMPGLPGSDYKTDLKNFRRIFTDPDFKPDMVKFYPCLVIKGTKLYDDWEKGNFDPLVEEKAVKLLAQIKSEIPKWVRVMRVNRDIPSNIISAGIKKTNLRQLVHEELSRQGKKCNCIRCREIGLMQRVDNNPKLNPNYSPDLAPKLEKEFYDASGGEEVFISFESKAALFGFVRLRNPARPFMRQITPRTALIRELHVYGKSLSLHERDDASSQHQGLGKELIKEAEQVAKKSFDAKKMVVISGLGVKEYYKNNFGYKKDGPFMSKKL